MDFSKRVANTWLMFYKKEPTPNLSQVLAFLLLLIPDQGSGLSISSQLLISILQLCFDRIYKLRDLQTKLKRETGLEPL